VECATEKMKQFILPIYYVTFVLIYLPLLKVSSRQSITFSRLNDSLGIEFTLFNSYVISL